MRHLTAVPSDPEQLRAWLDQLGRSAIGGVLDVRTPEISLPEAPRVVSELTFKLTLKGTKPPVWRRLVVAGDTPLDEVHEILQAAMGWLGGHLHRFHTGPAYDDPSLVTREDLEEGEEGLLEGAVRLDQVLCDVGDRVLYEYDFGDGWDHELRLEKMGPLSDPAGRRPRCLTGRLACPPEDCGGVYGYADLAAWVRAGRPADRVPDPFDSVADALEWLPQEWDPDEFDAEEVELGLGAGPSSEDHLAGLRTDVMAALLQTPSQLGTVGRWLAHAREGSLSASDIEDLTRPYRRLLAAVGGGVPLSASGWMPPDLVERLCAELEISEPFAGKANREKFVRPLASFRRAVMQAGLLHSQYGRLMPTVKGIQYADQPDRMWQQIASRLPSGRTELKRAVGCYTLVALAGGLDRHEVYDAVRDLCSEAGWEDSRRPGAAGSISSMMWPTLAALSGPLWMGLAPAPAWLADAAAHVIFDGQPG